MSERLRRDRDRRRPRRRALRRPPRRRRPAASRSSSASCVGGECDYWACIPSKTLLRPGEALQAAREAPGAREAVSGGVDVRRPPSSGATSWSPTTTTRPRPAGLEGEGHRACSAARRASPARAASRSGDDAHTAEHVVIATGSDPVIPPVPGLRELDGVWTNREATGAEGGPAPAARARRRPGGRRDGAGACARMGASVALVEGMDHVLPREPKPLGEALGEALAADGIELCFGAARLRRRAARTASTCSSSRSATSCAATGCWWRPAAARASRASASRASASSPGERGIAGRRAHERGRRRLGDRRRDRHLAAHLRGQVPGPRGGRQHPRPRPRQANYDAVPRVVFTDPQAAAVGEADGPRDGHGPALGGARAPPPTRAPTTTSPGFMTLVSDGERAHRRLRARPGGRRVAAAGDGRDPRRVPLEVMERRDPALPDLLGDLPARADRARRQGPGWRRDRSARRRWRTSAPRSAGGWWSAPASLVIGAAAAVFLRLPSRFAARTHRLWRRRPVRGDRAGARARSGPRGRRRADRPRASGRDAHLRRGRRLAQPRQQHGPNAALRAMPRPRASR